MFITGHNLLLIMSDKKKDDTKEDDSFRQVLAVGATAAVVGAVGLAAYGMYKLFGSLEESSRESPQEDVRSSRSVRPWTKREESSDSDSESDRYSAYRSSPIGSTDWDGRPSEGYSYVTTEDNLYVNHVKVSMIHW